MIEDYEDDDEHYCLKCHRTIAGLDNYIRHRKSGCRKNLDVNVSSQVLEVPQVLEENVSQTLTDTQQTLRRNVSESLHESVTSSLESVRGNLDDTIPATADDFFHSLELQSSAKKSVSKTIIGIQTRSKTYATLSHRDAETTSDVKESCYNPNNVETFNPSKKEDNRSRDYEDSDDYSDDYDYVDDDYDVDDDYPPRFHTGGKWKPSSSPIHWTTTDNRDWHTPPINYTGGKWKPTSSNKSNPPPGHTKGKWKPSSPLPPRDDVPPPTFTGSKWSSSKAIVHNVPPPDHTKGKWKPQLEWNDEESNKTKINVNETCTKTTKEREVPKIQSNIHSPFRKSNGTVQYWCGPCNRHLASKIVYERHLKSDLHHKRILKDRGDDFDDSLANFNSIDVVNPAKKKRKSVRKFCTSSKKEIRTDGMKTRKRQSIYVKCNVCRSRVRKQLMGKHLISHYHCRRSDITTEDSRKLVLDYIESIIHQSPFQCSPCSFFCNNQKDFLRHWYSESHMSKTNKYNGNFLCVFCKYESANNDGMYEHLISNEHLEVISVINRSVPIIIKKLDVISCETCQETFKLNLQLIKHCETEGHLLSNTSSNNYQMKFKCNHCNDKMFRSKIALHRHQRGEHKEYVYICRICDITFNNLQESKIHRRTCEHRYAVINERKREDTENPDKYQRFLKKCESCLEIFNNIIEYKKHVIEKHPNQAPTCPHCGAIFGIPQDLTVHTRQKKCSYSQKSNGDNSCDLCSYSTNSMSDYLFHKILHTQPLEIYPDSDNSKQPIVQYKCTFCNKLFVKSSLRFHLRIHTKERPYECLQCDKSFIRKTNFILHVKSHNIAEKKIHRKKKRDRSTEETNGKCFLCSTCGAKFKRRATLQSHMTIHNGKLYNCPESGCIYAGRNATDVKLHMVTHSNEKPYACETCSYKGKTKNQLARHNKIHEKEQNYHCPHCPFTTRLSFHLKRHIRLHTGAKPYACPHCNYKCNNFENLRKHILSTNIHLGKFIYECKYCENLPFKCNFAKEFKVHLVTAHSNVFSNNTEVTAFVTRMYESNEESKTTQQEQERKVTTLKRKDLSKISFYATKPSNDKKCQQSNEKICKKAKILSGTKNPIMSKTQSNCVINANQVENSIVFEGPQEGEEEEEEAEIFELLLDDNVEDHNCWNIVETSYDVVTFKSDEETLFQELSN